MDIDELITPAAVVARLRAANKKQLLQEISRRAADLVGLHERQIFDALLERERLGSTGVGNGIAIPHAKLPGLTRLQGLFVRLDPPVDFDAVDEQPVDLVFLLLAPEAAGADHLKALARVSRLLRDRQICEKLRGAEHPDALYALLTEPQASHHAAYPSRRCENKRASRRRREALSLCRLRLARQWTLTGSSSYSRTAASASARVGAKATWVPSAVKMP